MNATKFNSTPGREIVTSLSAAGSTNTCSLQAFVLQPRDIYHKQALLDSKSSRTAPLANSGSFESDGTKHFGMGPNTNWVSMLVGNETTTDFTNYVK